jgi:hypothetical protein
MVKGRCAGYRLGILMAKKFGTTGKITVELTNEILHYQKATDRFIRMVVEARKNAGKSKLRFGAKGGSHVRSLWSAKTNGGGNHSSQRF